MLQYPTPSPDAQQISLRLIEAIKQDMVSAGGSINFAQYMQAVLTKPELGYYSSGNQKFGSHGDFVTAPEVSPLFARCLARQCAGVLGNLSHHSQASILEFGAGSGIMAADMLLELEQLGSLPDQYLIMEISPDLKQRQQHTLLHKAAHLIQRVQWLDSLPDHNFTGVIVANEVLDAMPVHRVYKRGAEFGEYYVTWNGRQFEWKTGDFSDKPGILSSAT
jgi:SAM-dependent MidA family methyltransferase